MISEILGVDPRDAISGRELADMFGVNIRDITKQIRRERLEGQPICATTSGGGGYYLGDAEAVTRYCGRLLHRGKELFAVRGALLRLADGLPDQDQEGQEGRQ